MATDAEPGGSTVQSGPIAVYGATGYTGRLVARELRRRGADLVVAGRNRAKLDALAAELGGVRAVAASLDDAAALRELLEPCAAAIACAGPFTVHGEPVVAAAAETGTHYIDTTGEQGFIKMVFDRYGERAERSGAALVPGMGFDFVPGDMVAALTAAGIGSLDEIAIAYCVRGFAPTQGTALSALEIMRGDDVVWQEGEWRPAPRSAAGGRWRFREPIGQQQMLRYASGEQITVPRHVDTARVRTLLNGMILPPWMTALAAPASPLLGAALRTRFGDIAAALVRRLPAGPSERRRKAARFTIECEARAGSRVRRGTVSGSDVYGLTAVTTASAALLCADPSYDRHGALAPSQAFDPAAFLAALADFGVSTSLDPLPEPAGADRA